MEKNINTMTKLSDGDMDKVAGGANTPVNLDKTALKIISLECEIVNGQPTPEQNAQLKTLSAELQSGSGQGILNLNMITAKNILAKYNIK